MLDNSLLLSARMNVLVFPSWTIPRYVRIGGYINNRRSSKRRSLAHRILRDALLIRNASDLLTKRYGDDMQLSDSHKDVVGTEKLFNSPCPMNQDLASDAQTPYLILASWR